MVYLSTEDMKIRMEIIVTYEELLALGESYVEDLQPDQPVRISLFRSLSDIFIQLPSFLFCYVTHVHSFHFTAGSLRWKTPQDKNGFEHKNVRRWSQGINFSLIISL